MDNQPSTWLPNVYAQPENELKAMLLEAAAEYPNAFRILPSDDRPEDHGTWAPYEFDGTVSIWVNTSHHEAIDMYRNIFHQKKEKYMAKELTLQEQGTVKTLLKNNMQAIKSVLPKHLTPERMLRVAYTTIVQNPELGRCNQLSLINGVIGASVIGLEIGGPLGLAHLIPYKGEATLIIDYKGLIELMYKSPLVKNVSAQPVYENDDFRYAYGTNPYIEHRPYDGGDRGQLIYGYCIVFFANGGYEFEVVNRQDAMAAKEHSMAKGSKYSPWNTADEWAMWVKTAVRKISKRIPKSPELQRALNVDTAADEGQDVRDVIEADFEIKADDPAPKKEQTDQQTDIGPDPPNGENQTEPAGDLSPEDRKSLANLEWIRGEFSSHWRKAMNDNGLPADATALEVVAAGMAKKVDQKINELIDSERM